MTDVTPQEAWQNINLGYPTITKDVKLLQFIKNSITTIPNNIQLELQNGRITLKAGSKVYIPNGSGVFDVVTTIQDKNVNLSGQMATQQSMVFYRNDGIIYGNMSVTVCLSGDSLSGSGDRMFYNTTTNKINYVNGADVVSAQDFSFPLAIVSISGGQVISIDKVFNYIGYVGSTIFALPTIEGKVYGGTNIAQTVSITGVQTTNIENVPNTCWFSFNNNLGIRKQTKQYTEYNSFKDRVISKINKQIWMELILGEFEIDSNGKIINFFSFK